MHLGDIDNVAAHASGGDEAAGEEVLEGPAVDGGALLLLAAPVQRGGARAVQRPVHVDPHHLLHRVQAAVDEAALLPHDPRVRHEHVQPAPELRHDLVHRRLHRLPRRHVHLVRLA